MNHVARSVIGLIVAGAWLASPAFAAETADQPPAEPKSQAQPTPPQELARETVDSLLKELNNRREELRNNPQELYALINRELVPLVDWRYMSELVLGSAWHDATPEQRERFVRAFKVSLVRTYGNALLEFDNEKIEYEPVQAPADAKDITFNATVITDAGNEVPVSLNMHLVDGQWKAYDGQAGTVSFVDSSRGQFNALVRSRGLDDLITQMEKRYGIQNANAQ